MQLSLTPPPPPLDDRIKVGDRVRITSWLFPAGATGTVVAYPNPFPIHSVSVDVDGDRGHVFRPDELEVIND